MKRWLTFHNGAAEVHRRNPDISKQDFADELAQRFGLEQSRSVFHSPEFAVRFSFSNDVGFSNCVVSLATLRKFDNRPFLVCLLKPSGVTTFLTNTTFIKKVSHSSQRLSLTSIRGTILGHDISRECDGIANVPANFDDLYELHAGFGWEENLERIVAATTAIVPTGVRFDPTEKEIANILAAPARSLDAGRVGQLALIETTLHAIVTQRATAILNAADIDNVNLRGNAIEQLFTGGGNLHSIEDRMFEVEGQVRVLVDVKTKMLDLNSSPKLYNIDKMLRLLADGKSILCLYVIGIDRQRGSVRGCLVDVLDSKLIARTRIQFHWADRNSRGVTQLSNDTKVFLESGFRRNVDLSKATEFLNRLLSET